MRTISIDFPYFHKDFGKEVIVEVEFILYKGTPNAESDWDAQDYLEITYTGVYHEGDELSIDIPKKVIYSEISARIREAEIDAAFKEEIGGF